MEKLKLESNSEIVSYYVENACPSLTIFLLISIIHFTLHRNVFDVRLQYLFRFFCDSILVPGHDIRLRRCQSTILFAMHDCVSSQRFSLINHLHYLHL